MALNTKKCSKCQTKAASMRRCFSQKLVCKNCFFNQFEEEIHQTIIENKLFKKGECIAIGASGGKDSTVLAHVLCKLNKKHNYGLDLVLLSIDEGISGYRDDSLKTVKRNKTQYGLPLKILSYAELYKGWTMDNVVKKTGFSNNCTFCGVFRRQALDRGAFLLKADKIATGHNADDMAETVIMNLLRGDFNRLTRCTEIITDNSLSLPRCKPLKYCYEKEIVLYAFFKKLDYFSTECTYSPEAFRGNVREFIKDIERACPQAIIDIIKSGESFKLSQNENSRTSRQKIRNCERCGYMSSNKICKACVLLEGLERDVAKMSLGRKSTQVFNLKEPKMKW